MEDIVKNSKKCNVCLILKELSEYYKCNSATHKDGYQYSCKKCCNERSKENGWKYKGKYKNKQKISRKLWKIKNKKRIDKQQKGYRQKNKEKRNEYNRQWRNKNREHYNETKRKQNKRNSKKLKLRRVMDIKFNLDGRMSGAIRESLKENKKGRKWETLVGYNLDELKINLESKFRENMTWNDYLSGGVEIDHILPINLFEYENPEDNQFKACWCLDNLRPIWEWENHKKSDFLPDGRRASKLNKKEKLMYLIKLGYNFDDPEEQICG